MHGAQLFCYYSLWSERGRRRPALYLHAELASHDHEVFWSRWRLFSCSSSPWCVFWCLGAFLALGGVRRDLVDRLCAVIDMELMNRFDVSSEESLFFALLILCTFSQCTVTVGFLLFGFLSELTWIGRIFLKLVYFFIGLLAYLYLFIANCFWYFSWSLDFGLFRLFFICCCCLILIYLFDCLLVCLLSFLFILILFYVGSFLLYLMLLLDHSSLASRLFLKIHCSGFWWYAWILDFRPLGYSSILRSFHPSIHPPTRPSVRPSIFLSFICFIAMVFDTTPGS